MTDRTDLRTHYDSEIEVRYGKRYMAIQGRLYRRLDTAFNLIALFSGTAAFGGAVGSVPWLAATSGFFIAVLTIVQHVLKASEKALLCEQHRQRYAELMIRVDSMTMQEVDADLRKLHTFDVPHIESLRLPAYNQVMQEISRTDHMQKLSKFQKLMAAIS